MIQPALQNADHVLILLGSSLNARSHKNPFDHQMRENIIRTYIPEEQQDKIDCLPIRDCEEDLDWCQQVEARVNYFIDSTLDSSDTYDICLYGSRKDESSYYVDLFPQWKKHASTVKVQLSASEIRSRIFDPRRMPNMDTLLKFMNPAAVNMLNKWLDTPISIAIAREYRAITQGSNTFMVVCAKTIIQHGDCILFKYDSRDTHTKMSLPQQIHRNGGNINATVQAYFEWLGIQNVNAMLHKRTTSYQHNDHFGRKEVPITYYLRINNDQYANMTKHPLFYTMDLLRSVDHTGTNFMWINRNLLRDPEFMGMIVGNDLESIERFIT
jgi:nicotinamide mononucleotide adenylyltransferase